MTELTETHTTILSAAAKRPDNIAMPLPKGLAGAAAKMAVSKMIQPMVVQTVIATREHASELPTFKPSAQRTGTKRAMVIAMLQAPEGATIAEIVAATGWLAHTVRGAMSGSLGKKLGLIVTSAKEEIRGRVYRILISQ